jgi:hypothetical protein
VADQRRFPPPWHTEAIPGGYVVRDASGQSIAYVYSRETEVEARQANVLSKDEARRIARSCSERSVRRSGLALRAADTPLRLRTALSTVRA